MFVFANKGQFSFFNNVDDPLLLFSYYTHKFSAYLTDFNQFYFKIKKNDGPVKSQKPIMRSYGHMTIFKFWIGHEPPSTNPA